MSIFAAGPGSRRTALNCWAMVIQKLSRGTDEGCRPRIRGPALKYLPPCLRDISGHGCVQEALSALQLQAADLIISRPVMLFYRKDILANLSLPVPQTWDQLLQVGQGMGWGSGQGTVGKTVTQTRY